MKKLTAILALVLALCMFTACSFAEPGTEKYAEPVEVHFVRDTDDTLDANFFSQFPDKTMEDNLWCDLYRDQLNIIVQRTLHGELRKGFGKIIDCTVTGALGNPVEHVESQST